MKISKLLFERRIILYINNLFPIYLPNIININIFK